MSDPSYSTREQIIEFERRVQTLAASGEPVRMTMTATDIPDHPECSVEIAVQARNVGEAEDLMLMVLEDKGTVRGERRA